MYRYVFFYEENMLLGNASIDTCLQQSWKGAQGVHSFLQYKFVKVVQTIQQLTQCLLHLPFSSLTICATKTTYNAFACTLCKVLEKKYQVHYTLLSRAQKPTVQEAEHLLKTLPQTTCIVCIGDASLQEIGKYIAGVCQVPFISVPMHSFYAYTFTKYSFLLERVVPQVYVASTPYAVCICEELLHNSKGLPNMLSHSISLMCAWFEMRFQNRMFAKPIVAEYIQNVQHIVKQMVQQVHHAYLQRKPYHSFIIQGVTKLNFCVELWFSSALPFLPNRALVETLSLLSGVYDTAGEMHYLATSLYVACVKHGFCTQPHASAICTSQLIAWAKKYWRMPFLVFLHTHTPILQEKTCAQQKQLFAYKKRGVWQDLKSLTAWLKKAFFVWKEISVTNKQILHKAVKAKHIRIALALSAELSKRQSVWNCLRNWGVLQTLIQHV